MKVLHICTNETGGAGIAARRLHKGLLSIGVDSGMLVLRRAEQEGVVSVVDHKPSNWEAFRNRMFPYTVHAEFARYSGSRPDGLEIFSDDRAPYDIAGHPLVLGADILNLHWVANMVNYTGFFPKLIGKPKVWTLHDMNPFTGGCHYSGECSKYETECGACPQLGSKELNDLSHKIWRRKKRSYEGQNIHVATPSKWLAGCARRSGLFADFTVDVAPNGLPTDIFKRRDKADARRRLGLPEEGFVVLFGAQNTSVTRKGASYLVEALTLVEKKKKHGVVLAHFGQATEGLFEGLGLPVHGLGTISDEPLLSVCYSAADVFVLPSLEDNLPNTVLESMACATPVVAFDTGGVSDMVRHNETGLLSRLKDSEELAERIDWMIGHPDEQRRMGANARKAAEQDYAIAVQAKRYLELYESMLA